MIFPEIRKLEQKVTIMWEFLRFGELTKTNNYRNMVEKRKKKFNLELKWNNIFASSLEGEEDLNKVLKKLKPLSIDLMREYAHRIDSKFDVIDTDAEYKEGEETAKDGAKFYGKYMDKRKGPLIGSKSGHGPGRFLVPSQFITEQTTKEGNVHGLRRQINMVLKKIIFTLAKDGAESARVQFDFNLTENLRVDPQELLVDLTSESIR